VSRDEVAQCLTLQPFTTPMLHALALDRAAFANESGLQLAADWPHSDFADALHWLARLRESQPALADWSFVVVVDGRVVGDIGAKGTPVEGLVEVGYGIAASERRRGFAKGALTQFLAHCAIHAVHTVTAECLDENSGSIRVLEGAGFLRSGTRDDEAGQMLCWVKRQFPRFPAVPDLSTLSPATRERMQ
jgi:[ribosomal protein S5]-alanine N-acetyltransferase